MTFSKLSEFRRSLGRNFSLQLEFLICTPRNSDKTETKSQTGPWHSFCFPETQVLEELLMFLFVSVKGKVFLYWNMVASTEECHHYLCAESEKFSKESRSRTSKVNIHHFSIGSKSCLMLQWINTLQATAGARRNVLQRWGTFIATWPGRPLGVRHC